ncbi:DUF1804 family protein [Snodgrassella communis]|jgi:hypothetical protein|uniref:DUF1804 family protein n=1 Tax=Snodgrassella communis TaxID=2946699 RepID=UPI000460CF8E|nr:DUF1804 family protein [Snodgrassella communis]KDN12574.1 hypothetical protein SALWKB12_1098 [Snodgrassella communis]PIT09955.1 DNA-binding protein [Snodgrassella communis]PIT10264.1 DNA-binding protein [Snodgrassella communis]PIT25494.1 DNA-binding protein [Snodgrassella communis]PIT27093.1 DNA-binding protein [Snodgrassella communis]
MAHSQEIRDKVYRLYVFERRSLVIAAMMAEVAFSTARRWKESDRQKGNDWDKMRAANLMATGGLEDVSRSILSGFLVQYQATIDELSLNKDLSHEQKVDLLASLADAFNKTVAASRKVLPETDQLATVLDVINKLTAFIQERYPQHLAVFVEVLEPFGQEIQKSYS